MFYNLKILFLFAKKGNMKIYKMLNGKGITIESTTPGILGGNSKAKIYGRLNCPSANAALRKGYSEHRVFFATEKDAIDAGYRPCGTCMKEQYKKWKTQNK